MKLCCVEPMIIFPHLPLNYTVHLLNYSIFYHCYINRVR